MSANESGVPGRMTQCEAVGTDGRRCPTRSPHRYCWRHRHRQDGNHAERAAAAKFRKPKPAYWCLDE